VRQRLDENFTETPSLTELARIGGVHATHLARHFRRHFLITVGDYLRRRRVQAAIELLSGRILSFMEVALEAGFSSHAHTRLQRLVLSRPYGERCNRMWVLLHSA
jgi:AraC family transcriptional regulator